MEKIYDSLGIEINDQDMIECPEVPDNFSERWHVVTKFKNRKGEWELDIRDLDNNNSGMYACHGLFYNRGPYWKHLDKLNEEDLEYYWNTTKAEAVLKNS